MRQELSDLLNRECSTIDLRAEREKAGLTYLYDIIDKNYSLYKEVLLRKDFKEEFKGEEALKIFEKFERIIVDLEYEETRGFGVVVYHFDKGKSHSLIPVILNLANLYTLSEPRRIVPPGEIFTKKEACTLHVTEYGRELIDGYRAARGRSSLAECKKEASEMFFGSGRAEAKEIVA